MGNLWFKFVLLNKRAHFNNKECVYFHLRARLLVRMGLCLLKTNAWLFSVIGIVFVLIYIILFLSTGLDKIVMYNPWFAFLLCVLLSVGGFILSVLSIILSIIGKRTHIAPYFTVLLSFLLILFTIFVFLLPEAGIPSVIPLFFD